MTMLSMTCCRWGNATRARTRLTASSGTTPASGIGSPASDGVRSWAQRPRAWGTSVWPCSPGLPETTGSATSYLCSPKTLTLAAMPKYSFFVCNKRKRVKYPKSFYLADVEAARQVAVRIAQAFGRVVPGWNELSSDQQNNFTVEVMDEAGETVLTVPFKDAEQSKRETDQA